MLSRERPQGYNSRSNTKKARNDVSPIDDNHNFTFANREDDSAADLEEQLKQYNISEGTSGSNNQVQFILDHLRRIDLKQQNISPNGKQVVISPKGAPDAVVGELDKASKNIKLLNYELKRVVASDEETFVNMNEFNSNNIDCIATIPIYAKMQLTFPIIEDEDANYRTELPITFYVINSSHSMSADLEMQLSMDTKEPSDREHDKKILRKSIAP